jgi:hypothetical protein
MQQILKKAVFSKALLPLALAGALGAAAPAVAADVYMRQPAPRAAMVPLPSGPLTLQDALAIASGIGVVTVQNTHFDDNEWEIEGRDQYGKWIQVDIDARTGEVRHVDRSII